MKQKLQEEVEALRATLNLSGTPRPTKPDSPATLGGVRALTQETEAVGGYYKEFADPVNHPSHYNQGAVECIDAIEAALGPDGFRAYCKGNALKYVWREQHKGGTESLRKAIWYLDRLVSGR